MFTVDKNNFDRIVESKMDNNDKIDALNNVKKSIKLHRLDEAKYYGKISLASALVSGGLFSIDHKMFDAFLGKDVGSVSNINQIMFGAEAVASGMSFLGILYILETLENYINDTIEVNSYQKRLKPHK